MQKLKSNTTVRHVRTGCLLDGGKITMEMMAVFPSRSTLHCLFEPTASRVPGLITRSNLISQFRLLKDQKTSGQEI